MNSSLPNTLEVKKIDLKANVYFDGKVISHSIYDAAGKKTLGIIFPGEYTFNTGAPERMLITSGSCRVKLAGSEGWKAYQTGEEFKVLGNSSFAIVVDSGLAEYLCVFES